MIALRYLLFSIVCLSNLLFSVYNVTLCTQIGVFFSSRLISLHTTVLVEFEWPPSKPNLLLFSRTKPFSNHFMEFDNQVNLTGNTFTGNKLDSVKKKPTILFISRIHVFTLIEIWTIQIFHCTFRINFTNSTSIFLYYDTSVELFWNWNLYNNIWD